jgi:hypothetical protein
MAGLPCTETVERTRGSVAEHAPVTGVGRFGVVVPISPGAHL